MIKQIATLLVFGFLTIGAAYAQQDAAVAANSSAQTVTPSGQTTELPIKHRIVMHMSSADTLVWKGLMNNIKHLREGWGDSVAIEVVVHGPGIGMLIMNKTTQREKIGQFSKLGVKFVACENTIRERKIDKSTILPDAGFVPMGVGEIVLKQEQGWSYIKVGF